MNLKKRDYIFILSIITICILLFAHNFISKINGDTVFIYYDSLLYTTVSLSENKEININNTNTLVVENGTVYMKDATCPDKLCINQGKISDSRKNIVCLPNKITVKVDNKSEIDSISQ